MSIIPTEADLVKHFRYLDNVRESGAVNMFGAGEWLEQTFGLEKRVARSALSLWMKTFDGESSPEARAEIASQTAA